MSIAFYLLIYLTGFICVLPLSKKVPAWFLIISGYVWGLVVWVFCSMIILLCGIPYTWQSMTICISPFIASAVLLSIKLKVPSIKLSNWALLVLTLVMISLLSWKFSETSYVYATQDSFNYINLGRVMAKAGLQPWAIGKFTKLGLFTPVIQMVGVLQGGEYTSGYQTIMSGILIAILFVSNFQTIKKNTRILTATLLAGLLIPVFVSMIYVKHSFYIHNNLPAGVYLFLAVYAYWCFLQRNEPEWLILGTISITAFSFTRIEGVLFVVIILILTATLKEHTYHRRLWIILPYSVIALSWHIYLLLSVTTNEQLSKQNLLIITTVLCGLIISTIISKWFPKITRKAPQLTIILLLMGLSIGTLLKTDHILVSIKHYWQNLMDVNSWGWTWILILALFPPIIFQKKHPPENLLLLYWIASYILVIFLLVFARIPYRLGETDSANRLMVQILPIIVFTIASNIGALRDNLHQAEIPTD